MSRQQHQSFGTCGVFSFISMLFFGSLFGGIGVVIAHFLTKHLSDYYLILIPAIVLGILFGLGLNLGAKIGRCSKFSALTFLFVFVFSLIVYAKLLFFNNYHDSYAQNATLGEEALFLTVDSWNMLDAIPFVTNYIAPLTDQQARDAVANIPVLSSLVAPAAETPITPPVSEQSAPNAETPAEQPTPTDGAQTQTPPPTEAALSPDVAASAASPSPREHIGRQLFTFIMNFPQYALAEKPVVIGTIFHLAILAPVRQYLEFPGFTKWDAEAANGRLLFDERAVKPWMAWSVEWLFVWLIAVLMTRSGTKKAYDSYQKRLTKKNAGKPQGLQIKASVPAKTEEEPQETEKKKKPGFSLFGKKKAKTAEEPPAREEPSPAGNAEAKKAEKKKKGGFFGFGKKKTKESEQNEDAAEQSSAAGKDELTLPNEEPSSQEQLYAIILHQFNPQRQDDLVRLLQQVGQVSEESAKKLLKTPSLVKRDVNTQQANIAIQKFQQVQAQVKLVTMEQLAQLQNKQRQAAPQPSQPTPPPLPAERSAKAPASQPQKSAPAPVAPSTGQPGEKYALILRKFDQAQRKQVVELLSSLSGTPVTQLQQSLKTPALVLRDASRDEVIMISQQFQKIQAETKMLTMAELQKLTNKSG